MGAQFLNGWVDTPLQTMKSQVIALILIKSNFKTLDHFNSKAVFDK